MSKFEKSRGLPINLSIIVLKRTLLFLLIERQRGKVLKLLYMRFKHFFYNRVETFCFQTSIKTCFLDIFRIHVKKSWYVEETCFFSSLEERNTFFSHYRFYVGVLRRLRDVSVVFDENPLFSGFFDFF
jgi:hypothetical protein